MMNPNYRRSVEELKEVASMFWPSELSDKAATLSIIPKLLETQEQFISILNVDVSTLEDFFQVIDGASLKGSLFLKHLMVLSDVGAEMIDRWNSQFESLFPLKKLSYLWKGRKFEYKFNQLPLPIKKISNKKLGISGEKLLTTPKLDTFLMEQEISREKMLSKQYAHIVIALLLSLPQSLMFYTNLFLIILNPNKFIINDIVKQTD